MASAQRSSDGSYLCCWAPPHNWTHGCALVHSQCDAREHAKTFEHIHAQLNQTTLNCAENDVYPFSFAINANNNTQLLESTTLIPSMQAGDRTQKHTIRPAPHMTKQDNENVSSNRNLNFRTRTITFNDIMVLVCVCSRSRSYVYVRLPDKHDSVCIQVCSTWAMATNRKTVWRMCCGNTHLFKQYCCLLVLQCWMKKTHCSTIQYHGHVQHIHVYRCTYIHIHMYSFSLLRRRMFSLSHRIANVLTMIKQHAMVVYLPNVKDDPCHQEGKSKHI